MHKLRCLISAHPYYQEEPEKESRKISEPHAPDIFPSSIAEMRISRWQLSLALVEVGLFLGKLQAWDTHVGYSPQPITVTRWIPIKGILQLQLQY